MKKALLIVVILSITLFVIVGCFRLRIGGVQPVVISDDNWNEVVVNNEKPVVVDFFATWCGPCNKMHSVVDKAAYDYEGLVIFGKVDIDKSRQLAKKNGVRSVPTFVIFVNGEEVDRASGVMSKLEFYRFVDNRKH